MREGGGGDKSGGMYEGNGMEWDIPRYFRYLLTLLFILLLFSACKDDSFVAGKVPVCIWRIESSFLLCC